MKQSSSSSPRRLASEIVRKCLHFLIALAPALASLHYCFTLVLLAAGTASYVLMEALRRKGWRIPVVSPLTDFASRRRDRNRFVLGPFTLGAGAFLALLLFPPQTAAIAVYALAFGDGTASLTGKTLGRLRHPFLFGKSVEGSLSCFAGTFISAFLASGSLRRSLVAAGAATITELPPIRDWDNIIIPLATGLAVTFWG
ncbi:MAG: SEC59/DGK1/VTE5 family protein [Treponema sp.]|jgi:dolichol kinase|nr:SEC59/DGK1/VTE5 family protein [Treponema sp.]